jgi:hypothetical protein
VAVISFYNPALQSGRKRLMLCCAAGWSISKQALEVDELKQAADLANERAAQASGAQQLRQVQLLSLPLL